jgi:hypothetical protein
MWYSGSRNSVPSARYHNERAVMRRYGWTYQQLLDQPWDLIAEDMIEISKEHLAAQRAK